MNAKIKFIILLLVISLNGFWRISPGITEAKETQKAEKEKTVSQLLLELKSDRALTRALATKELGERNNKEVTPYIIEALKDKDLSVKWEACLALGKIIDKTAIPALIERLKDKKENWSVQTRAAEALANIADVSALEPLLEVLKKECEQTRAKLVPPVRQSIGSEDEAVESMISQSIFKLAVSSKGECNNVLIEKVGEAKDMSKFKYYTAIILGQLGEKKVVPILIEYLKKSENGLFRERCARILGDLGDKTALEPLKEALKDNYICISTGDVKKVYGHTVRLAAYSSLKKLCVNVEKKGDEYRIIE